MGMKTLGQIENEVRSLTSAFTIMERTRGTEGAVYGIKAAQDRQGELFASLAAWDAVVREFAPRLQEELKLLINLRDEQEIKNRCWMFTDFSRLSLGLMCDVVREEDFGDVQDCRINTTGLARLEHLRAILGEEG